MQIPSNWIQRSAFGVNLLMLAIVIELRVKVGMLWTEFKKRKRLY